MATTKKPAVKTAVKAAVKAAAKAVTKKPAKAAAKKTTAKKTTAAKKPTVKSVVKTLTAKPKKAAVKKPAAKAASAKATTVKKASSAKTATKAAVKKTAVTAAKKPAVKDDENVKFRNLFDAYAQGKLPFVHGYIVSSFFSEKSAYSIYEIVSYAGVKEIFMTETGLQFVTGGKKLYVLVEPATYQVKFLEPVSRAEGERIPKRFSELETIIDKYQTKIMIAKEPNDSYGSFTVLKPLGQNFAIVFYDTPGMYKTLCDFFVNTLNRQRKVAEADAKKAAAVIVKIVEKAMSFKGEYA
ncbi:MAG: hypothetical protein FWD26_04160 [Treponema sp.]|nr:hypothetical protein [Treponema sp.]